MLSANAYALCLCGHVYVHRSAAVFMKAADLMSTKYRYDLLATTMLGQVRGFRDCILESVEAIAALFQPIVQITRSK